MHDVELLELLSEWYRDYGIKVETLDNPGWIVKTYLDATALGYKPFEIVQFDHGTDDWMHVSKRDAKFKGAGDPSKLHVIFEHFLRFAGKI